MAVGKREEEEESPRVSNEWADAGRDSRGCLARPNSQTPNKRWGKIVFHVKLMLIGGDDQHQQDVVFLSKLCYRARQIA